MCGIIGIVGQSEAAPRLLEALKRLEYRGYDSAGIATLVNNHIDRRRAEGKLSNLGNVLSDQPLAGITGIGHTRWATHGAPNETNAHPHATDKVAVVHNGIIENFRALRQEVQQAGYALESDTDSEVIAHLITHELNNGASPEAATHSVLQRLEGAFGIGVLFAGREDLLIGARQGSPLVVGIGKGETYLGSDAIALGPLADELIYLEEGDWAVLRPDVVDVFDATGNAVDRPRKKVPAQAGSIEKGNFPHFMLKEIYEQPAVVGETLNSYFDPLARQVVVPQLPFDWPNLSRLTIVACGTAFYAGQVAKYWFEKLARLPVEVDIASEFRYREAPMPAGGAALFISQSGETADTLAALRYARGQGQHILSVVNVPDSSIARESDLVLPTHAGPEIGVASTKAFTCQLTVLACLAIAAAKARGVLDAAEEARLSESLAAVPALAAEVLNHDEALQAIAADLKDAPDVIYMGRGPLFPLAMEGALKLKEISYIHAEGYAAGELKHGPIALIDDGVPIIVLAPSGALFDKTASNMQEVIARGGRVVMFSDAPGLAETGDGAQHSVALPEVCDIAAPILYALPVQLLAYHVSVLKGTDVDQPRNLAKSVTVE